MTCAKVVKTTRIVGVVKLARSPWLAENLTPAQRAYARELAIERMERR